MAGVGKGVPLIDGTVKQTGNGTVFKCSAAKKCRAFAKRTTKSPYPVKRCVLSVDHAMRCSAWPGENSSWDVAVDGTVSRNT